MLCRVVGVNTVPARNEEAVEPVGYATDGYRIIGCFYRVARGSGQPLADAAPVGGQRNRAVIRMRGVVDGVFHAAPRKQCCYCHCPDKLIYPVSFHISRFNCFLFISSDSPNQADTRLRGAPEVLCFLSLFRYTHAVGDSERVVIEARMTQTEIKVDGETAGEG